MNNEKLNKKTQAVDKEVKKDLDRSENEGFSVMYASEKKKQKARLSLKEQQVKVLHEVS